MPVLSRLGQIFIVYSLFVFIDIPAATWTGHSEGQEPGSPAASQETGQTNLLAVTWWDLMAGILNPHLELRLQRTGNRHGDIKSYYGTNLEAHEYSSLRRKKLILDCFYFSPVCRCK